jgi:methyl-accepting chemotaxis protein
MSKENARLSDEAAALSGSIKVNAEKGSEQMAELMRAVSEITEASNSITKVIKVIDDIAFQTNILALNAAVEAARAGQHGKGFAVVAEEVRNLAAKSAASAKDTGKLIEDSIEKSSFGLTVAEETAESLKEIVEGINRSAEIVTAIAQASEEQTNAVSQVNIGIDQVSQVIQQNSATAQESAAASEEMSGQATMLHSLVGRFRLRGAVSRLGLGSGIGAHQLRGTTVPGLGEEPRYRISAAALPLPHGRDVGVGRY